MSAIYWLRTSYDWESSSGLLKLREHSRRQKWHILTSKDWAHIVKYIGVHPFQKKWRWWVLWSGPFHFTELIAIKGTVGGCYRVSFRRNDIVSIPLIPVSQEMERLSKIRTWDKRKKFYQNNSERYYQGPSQEALKKQWVKPLYLDAK